MNNEWRDLPTMADVAAAQSAEKEIERDCFDSWTKWNGLDWNIHARYRARPAQPKMKKVKILGWPHPVSGATMTCIEGFSVPYDWVRYPKLDDEIEVP